MAALTKERDTVLQGTNYDVVSLKVKGNVKILNGSFVMTDATGYAVPGNDTANCFAWGRANATVDTTAAGPKGLLGDGVVEIEVQLGKHIWNNPAGANQLTQANVGGLAYLISDNEVTRKAGTSGGAGNVIAGRVTRVDTVNNLATVDETVHAV